jgi:hypothetical protein
VSASGPPCSRSFPTGTACQLCRRGVPARAKARHRRQRVCGAGHSSSVTTATELATTAGSDGRRQSPSCHARLGSEECVAEAAFMTRVARKCPLSNPAVELAHHDLRRRSVLWAGDVFLLRAYLPKDTVDGENPST